MTMLYNSYDALLVAELAKEKGLSNEFSDKMFENNFKDCLDISNRQIIEKTALSVGLTDEAIEASLTSEKYREQLRVNNALGRSYEVNSIPTFIINDKYKVVGSRSKEEIKKVFDQILKDELS
jgi:predicted DsbA family dithiol-disulfide isomerase